MLVDPATGMPVDDPSSARTLGTAAMTGLDQLGYTQETMPLGYDLLSSIPGAVTSSAWNMNRVSNTMIRGGKSQRRAMRTTGSSIGGRGWVIEGSKETFSPRRFFRMSRARMIDPSAMYDNMKPPKGTKETYSPFGFLSKTANNMVGGRGLVNTVTGGRAAKLSGHILGKMKLGEGTDFTKVDAFSRGTFGRMAAMANIGDMSEKQLAKRAGSITSSVMDLEGKRIDLGRRAKFPGLPGLDDMTHMQRRATYEATVGNTIKGPISGNVAGYFRGAQNARMYGNEAAEALAKASKGPFGEGVAKGVAAFNRGGALGKFAGGRLASVGMRAAGPIGAIFLAKDIALMFGKVAGAVGKTIIDAGKSLMAPLNKGVMGAQFRDNSVAATARQRGVMAIANSRLNMRSVLGHEAAAMAAHYG